jgi:monofunctional glycosyltransferase
MRAGRLETAAFTPCRLSSSSRVPGEAKLDLSRPVEATHRLGQFGLNPEPFGVDAGDRGAEPAVAAEKLVSERDHAGVRPRLRPDPEKPGDNGVLRLVRMSLRQDHQHRSGRARYAGMAVDQEVANIGRIAGERQDRLDDGLLRQHDAGVRLDRVVKPERGPKVRIELLERLRLRPFGVKKRENVGDAPRAVEIEFVKAADGQGGKGERLHAGTPNTKGGSAATHPTARPDRLPGAPTCARLKPVVRRRSLLAILARGAGWAGVALLVVFAGLVALYSVVPPVSTLMLARMIEGKSYERDYVRLRNIAPAAIAAVVASEDASFCVNDGVDWGALHEVLSSAGGDGPSRGASTITMQTAKNLFLWPGRSVIRKGIEIGMALVLGKAWSKARMIEIYLNIAEWGDGIYGIEAAAHRYFHKSARELNAREAALMATALPNPDRRNPAHPTALHRRLAASIEAKARDNSDRLACLPHQSVGGHGNEPRP